MRHLLAALCFALAGVAAQAQEDGIEATISAQLDALEAGNFSTAFSYASPMIRGRFGTAANFAEMVARGYGVMLRPVEVTFLERRKAGSGHWQRVMLRAADGAVALFDYEMLPGADGGWQINAVVPVPMPELSA